VQRAAVGGLRAARVRRLGQRGGVRFGHDGCQGGAEAGRRALPRLALSAPLQRDQSGADALDHGDQQQRRE
jgi:hypothetical protein